MENLLISRRKLLEMSGLGVGSLAFVYLLHAEDKPKLGSDLRSKPGHFPAKARSVIQLVQNGGAGPVAVFDRKFETYKRPRQREAQDVGMFPRRGAGQHGNVTL